MLKQTPNGPWVIHHLRCWAQSLNQKNTVKPLQKGVLSWFGDIFACSLIHGTDLGLSYHYRSSDAQKKTWETSPEPQPFFTNTHQCDDSNDLFLFSQHNYVFLIPPFLKKSQQSETTIFATPKIPLNTTCFFVASECNEEKNESFRRGLPPIQVTLPILHHKRKIVGKKNASLTHRIIQQKKCGKTPNTATYIITMCFSATA